MSAGSLTREKSGCIERKFLIGKRLSLERFRAGRLRLCIGSAFTAPEAEEIFPAAAASVAVSAEGHQQIVPEIGAVMFARANPEFEAQTLGTLCVFKVGKQPDVHPGPLIAIHASKRIGAQEHFADFQHALPTGPAQTCTAAVLASISERLHTAKISLFRA